MFLRENRSVSSRLIERVVGNHRGIGVVRRRRMWTQQFLLLCTAVRSDGQRQRRCSFTPLASCSSSDARRGVDRIDVVHSLQFLCQQVDLFSVGVQHRRVAVGGLFRLGVRRSDRGQPMHTTNTENLHVFTDPQTEIRNKRTKLIRFRSNQFVHFLFGILNEGV